MACLSDLQSVHVVKAVLRLLVIHAPDCIFQGSVHPDA